MKRPGSGDPGPLAIDPRTLRPYLPPPGSTLAGDRGSGGLDGFRRVAPATSEVVLPAREGRLSSQPPRGSQVYLNPCLRTTSFLRAAIIRPVGGFGKEALVTIS
jgi:hypothetical protein